MILPPDCKLTVTPLSNQTTNHCFIPTMFRAAIARSRGSKHPSGRRVSASPWTGASTMARLRTLGVTVCIAMTVAPIVLLSNDVAYAEVASLAMQRARPSPIDSFPAFIREASQRLGVPEHWIRAVIRVESAGNVRARSRKGAMGLMQIMPKTWDELRARYGLGTDPYDPHDNILAGAAYIRELHDKYSSPGFLAAYNAGPRRYETYLSTGRSLPEETQHYIATLMPMISLEPVSGNTITDAKSLTLAHSPLFVVRTASNSTVDRLSPSVSPDRPSSVRTVHDLSALVPQPSNLFVRRASEVRSQ